MSAGAESAGQILDALAQEPRFAGTAPESAARGYCARKLAAAGFVVSEEEFSFSAFPAAAGPPLLGVAFALFTLGAGMLSWIGMARAGLGAAIFGIAVVALTGRVLLRWGALEFPAMRRRSINLVGERGNGPPGVWLVAHLDSKSQTIPMLVRVVSVAISGVLFAGLVLALALRVSGAIASHSTADEFLRLSSPIVAVFSAAAVLPMILCFVTNRSPGALDNASGVAAVLLAVESVEPATPIGVVLTSGEELALAGARAFARERTPGIAINCDTIDDAGRFICMVSKRVSSAARVQRAAAGVGETVRVRGMIAGILADNVALSDAGWDSCTLSRGNLGTLARVHTSGDARDALDGTGIARAARILASTVKEMC